MNNEEMWRRVRMATEWLDKESSPSEDPRILRCFKIAEELGEVTAAIIGATGQNPRKGVTHTWADVQDELCDVILAAMVALDSLGGNPQQQFERHLEHRHARMLALSKPECLTCGDEATVQDGEGDWWCGSCARRLAGVNRSE